MRLLLLGATGLVGSHVLEQVLADDRISRVVAPTRQALPNHTKLDNPVSTNLLAHVPEVASWKVSAVICATGTTMRKAGSKKAFYNIDHDLPLAFARAAHAGGADTFAFVSAMGASLHSRFFYSRLKAETERDLQDIGFRSLTVLRPGFISGRRGQARFAESAWTTIDRLLGSVLPKALRIISAGQLAEALADAAVFAGSGYTCKSAGEISA